MALVLQNISLLNTISMNLSKNEFAKKKITFETQQTRYFCTYPQFSRLQVFKVLNLSSMAAPQNSAELRITLSTCFDVYLPPSGQNPILVASICTNMWLTETEAICWPFEVRKQRHIYSSDRRGAMWALIYSHFICPADEWKSNNHFPASFSGSSQPPEGNIWLH